MSMKKHHTSNTPHGEHGTTKSYVIGYLLSLVFTLVPYYLVVNKVMAGSTLLYIILGVAVVQLFVQIFFFLHLGRGPKPFYNIVFFFATAGIIVLAVGGSLFIMNNLYRNMSPGETIVKLAQKEGIAQVGGEETGACQGNKNSNLVIIRNATVSPLSINANRCDTLTFINEDKQERTVTFGVYPARESYGGEYEIVLHSDDPETITLNESGQFNFYDELEPGVRGSFTVSP